MSRLSLLLLAAAFVLLFGVWALARSSTPTPRLLTQVDSLPVFFRLHQNVWYWLEPVTNGKPGRLMRHTGARPGTIAEGVSSFDAGGGGLAWSKKDGGIWKIETGTDKNDARPIWTGKSEPRGLKLSGGTVYWMTTVAGIEPESALPPISDSVELWMCLVSSGNPRRVAQIMEAEPGEIIGINSDSTNAIATLSAFRPGYPGATVFYNVALDSGAATRTFGAEGRNFAVKTSDGSIYWSGPSAESSEYSTDACVRKRSSSGQIQTIIDWMPPGGAMFASGSDAYFVDGSMEASIWPARKTNALPESLRIPRGFGGAAVADGRIVLFTREPPGKYTLYEMDIR